MNKRKQTVNTMIGMICTGILFLIAMFFPQFYNQFYDEKTLNQAGYMDIDLSAYETAYTSMKEKLYAIAKCVGEGKHLRAVENHEAKNRMDDAKLTEIVEEELDKVLADTIDTTAIMFPYIKWSEWKENLNFQEAELSEQEMYTLYTADGKETIQGINCWKLLYDCRDYKLTVYLDEEYHKIYFIEIRAKKRYEKYKEDIMGITGKIEREKLGIENVKYSDTDKKNGYTMTGSTVYDSSSTDSICEWFRHMVSYYGLREDEWYAIRDNAEVWDQKQVWSSAEYRFRFLLAFDSGHMLEAGMYSELSQDKYQSWKIGIPLDEMLQF